MGLGSSLCMIHVTDLQIHVHVPWDKKKAQARFTHRGIPYWLRVTDSIAEAQHLAQPVGVYGIGEACLTISLGEPFTKPADGASYVYKLVAGIIRPY
jgi:hypothetical protein